MLFTLCHSPIPCLDWKSSLFFLNSFKINISASKEHEESSGDEGMPEDDELSTADIPAEFKETWEGLGEKSAPNCCKN